MQDPLEFPANELRKFFKMGDHVKVIRGRYEGDTGLIVRVEDNIVVLFSDLTMHEVNDRDYIFFFKVLCCLNGKEMGDGCAVMLIPVQLAGSTVVFPVFTKHMRQEKVVGVRIIAICWQS